MVYELKKALSPYFSKEETEINDTILDMVDSVCKEQIEPYAREMDKIGAKMIDGKVVVPPQMNKIVDTFRKNDMFGINAAEKYGGSGLSHTLLNAMIDRVARADSSTGSYLSLQGALVDYITTYGSDELKEKYLPDLAKGKRLGGFLYTESGSGSDLGSVKTKAVREGDKYIINGGKIFITNAGINDTFSFLASTDSSKGSRGLTAFILDARNQPGFKVIRLEDKLGIHASPTGQISLENVEIPVENRLGEENKGLGIILYGLSASRNGVAASAVGIAEAAYRKALQYVNERKQFGTKIIDFQGTQWKIADMVTKIATGRNYYIYSSRLKDMEKDFFREASIAKVYCSEMAQQVCYEAIQMHGGNGYISEYDVERYYRDARIKSIYEGTSEVQRLIIAREEMKKIKN